MRLTALLPPPPTPTTLILADSIGEKEHLNRVGLGLCFEKPPLILVLCSEWDVARNEEEIGSSLSCANGLIAILDFTSERLETKKKNKDGSFRVLVWTKKQNINSGVYFSSQRKAKEIECGPFSFLTTPFGIETATS